MNLLITNSHGAQACAILHALRPYAARVVATVNGTTRWKARMSHACTGLLLRPIDSRGM